MDMPKFVKYTGDGDGAGIGYGDVLKVLTCGRFHPTFLYVETPFQSKYCGSSAMNENKLKGKNFTYLADYEYEIVKEEEKVESKHKFKVGDIVCGNGDRYAYTNSNMTKGRVVDVNPYTGFIDIKVLKHKLYNDNGNTTFTNLDCKYFDLVESKSAVVPQIPTSDTLYHITTDMKTFVDVEHNGNKGWSKCDARYDEFDIHTGINLALERLNEVENPPVPKPVKKLPKYVKYIGASGDGGLNNGDICRVLSGVIKGTTMYDDTLFVASPSPTMYNNANASNPSALDGVNFTYLWPDKYEIVDFNIHD